MFVLGLLRNDSILGPNSTGKECCKEANYSMDDCTAEPPNLGGSSISSCSYFSI